MNKRVVVCIMVLPALLMIGLIIWRSRHSSLDSFSVNPDPTAFWKNLNYTPVTRVLSDPNTTFSNRQKIENQFTQKQLTELEMLTKKCLKAYSSGNYQDYIEFRFPTLDFRFKPNFFLNVRKMMQAEGVSTNQFATDFSAFEWWWDYAIKTNNNVCSKCWEGVSLESIQVIRAELSKDPKTKLSQDISGRINLVPAIFPSSLGEFTETLVRNTDQSGEVFVVVVSMILKETNGAFRPVFVEAHWSDIVQKWLPQYLGLGQYGGESPIFCF